MGLQPIVVSHNGVHRITFTEQESSTMEYIQSLIKALNDNEVPVMLQPVLTFSTPRKNTPLKIGKKPSKRVSEAKVILHNTVSM